MDRTVLACSLVFVIACTQLARAAAVPLPAAMSDGQSRTRRSTHPREDTRLTLILNGNMEDDVTNAEAVSGRARRAADLADSVATRRRLRRSHGARQAETGRQQPDGLAEVDGERLSTSARRRRSTAAFWLQASIQLCNKHPHMCRRIVVVDGDVHMNIRLMDE